MLGRCSIARPTHSAASREGITRRRLFATILISLFEIEDAAACTSVYTKDSSLPTKAAPPRGVRPAFSTPFELRAACSGLCRDASPSERSDKRPHVAAS